MCALFGYSSNCTYGVAQANGITTRMTGRQRIPWFVPGDLRFFFPLYEERKTNNMQQLDVYY